VRVYFRHYLIAVVLVGLAVGLALPDGTLAAAEDASEVLYNGIVLPAQWPPQRNPSQIYQIPSYIQKPPPVILIDTGRQLFVDDFLIESTTLSRKPHRPVMYPGNPVLSPGGADNHNAAMPYSDGVWYDPADHLFKIWYYGGYTNVISYAYSTDGVTWIKPSIRDAAVPNTNMLLVIGGARDSTTVWMDLADPDPSRKFKAFAYYPWTHLDVYFSPDGIHWTKQPYTIPTLSDRTTVFYNPFRSVWVNSLRAVDSIPAVGAAKARRSRVRYYQESRDLLNWTPSNASFWVGPDERDPPYQNVPDAALPELYNLDATPYESLLVGLFSWFEPGPQFNPSSGPGRNIVELGVGFSRDGYQWVRPTRGSAANAFIPASDVDSTWNAYNTQSAGGGFLVVGDELWFYFSGRTMKKPNNGVMSTGLAKLRRDGFYSMDAGSVDGVLTTRPVKFSGNYLFVNVNDPRGQLTVEVLDQNGNVVAPFSRGNAVPIAVNNTIQKVAWTGAADLSSLAGKHVRFRFYLQNGELYSFWVTRSIAGASHGYVAAGGPGLTAPTDTEGSRID